MASPVLSISMPTRNRPQLLERALRSLVTAMAPVAEQVEVTVSDGSDADTSGRVVENLLKDWPGGHRYVWNRPALPLVENMNRAAELATGEWLRRLLRDSSFVREPMVVVRRAALVEAGLFDLGVGDATDTDMWVRLFSRHGARCLPITTCAYTIHQAAATTGMWNPRTIEALGTVFDRAVASGVVPEQEIRRWQSDYLHQFILAGAYRRLRVRRRAEARDVLRLFRLPAVRALGPLPPVAARPARPRDRDREPALGVSRRAVPLLALVGLVGLVAALCAIAYYPFTWDPPRTVRNTVVREADGSLRFGAMNRARTVGTPGWLRLPRSPWNFGGGPMSVRLR